MSKIATVINNEKKQLVLSILSKLFNVWDMAESLYEFVNGSYITDEILDFLIKIINDSVDHIIDIGKREQMNKAINQLKIMKQKESEERKEEEEELKEIEDKLMS